MNWRFNKSIVFVATALLGSFLLSGCVFFGVSIGKKRPGVDTPGGGVYKSFDQGLTWQSKNLIRKVKKKLAAIDTLHVKDIQFDPQDHLTLYLVSFYRGLWVTYNGGENWQSILDDPVKAAAVDPRTRAVIYAARKNQVVKSANGGNTWKTVFLEGSNQNISALAVDTAHNKIFAGAENGRIFESLNGGDSWKTIATIGGKIVKLLVHPLDSRIMYVGTQEHGVFKSADGGITWTLLTALSSVSGTEVFGDLAMNTAHVLEVFYGSRSGLLKSTDGGATFASISLLTPNPLAKIEAIAVDPYDSNIIFYASSTVLFTTRDGGGTWVTEALPLPKKVARILIDPSDARTMYVGFNMIPEIQTSKNNDQIKQKKPSRTKL